MIEQIDTTLKEWVQTVSANVDVSLAPPDTARPGSGISLYLIEVINAPASRGATPAPLQVMLRYLVTAWGQDAAVVHKLIGDLMFAALRKSEFEVELEPIPVEFWRALHALPCPSFVLRAPLRLEQPGQAAKPVSKPPVLRMSPVTSLEGAVLGPEGIPIMDAVVELPSLDRRTRTDRKGRFRFPTVPAEPPITELKITAKGRSLTVSPARNEKQPMVIHFDRLEV